jgi:hypothetical protein
VNRLVQIFGSPGVHGGQIGINFAVRGEDDDRDIISIMAESL